MLQKNIRSPWLNYLLGFITLLVVAHHSSLPYAPFARFNKAAYNSSTHPIVDTVRWDGIDFFADYNDTFLIPLIFFISGIFAISRLSEGGYVFIKNSFFRLMIPFSIGVTFIALLACYPGYLQAHGTGDIKAYASDFFTVELWPAGPAWLLWVLFLFGAVFALMYPAVKGWLYKGGDFINRQQNKPAGILILFYLISWCLYLSLVLWIKPEMWKSFGPLDFQVSRGFLYFGYFVIGGMIGSTDFENGIFSRESAFVKRWPLWILLSLAMYTVLQLIETPLHHMIESRRASEIQGKILYRTVWILSSVFTCVAYLTLFRKLFSRVRPLWESISANAFGIYLIHYIFVLWCQYYLLSQPLNAISKTLITFMFAYLLSWVIIRRLRRIPVVNQYLTF